MRLSRALRTLSIVAAAMAAHGVAWASYGFYVGKDLTADGRVLIGGTGEEVSSHWLEIVPAHEHPEGATVTVGVTGKASIPGELIEIPQVARTARFIAMYYSDYKGFPPPLTNGGLNEHQVAVRDIWSPSREELVEMTPTPQRGLNYSDLARIVLERARTARGGVKLMGELIAEHGYATYGGNSHLIADANEGWIVIEFAGGQGLWVAERLGADDVRVSYPGYIGDVPTDYLESPDFMGSPNLISFAVEQGWYDPEAGEPFNVHEVYGRQDVDIGDSYKLVHPMTLEDELRELAGSIRVQDLMAWVRDPRIANEEAGYGQVAALGADTHPDLGVVWVAPTGSVTAPFIPYHLGAEHVPPEYRQHRYLTKDAGRTFLAEDYQAQEATEFAGRVFKRLMYFTCDYPDRFLPEVTEALEAFEAAMIAELPRIQATARALYREGQPELARDVLTRYSVTQAGAGLELGKALLGSIEARTEVLYGIREPVTDRIHEAPVSGRDIISCITSRDADGPVHSADTIPERPPEVNAPEVSVPAQAAETHWFGLGAAFALGLVPAGAFVLIRGRRRS